MAKMYIGGESVDSITGQTYEVRNPANGEVVDTVPKGNAEDVRSAIDSAEAAFEDWAHTSAEERARLLFKA
ncbi:MAG TPA: aldehyde dehydrogenase family protein, partial [Blastocatellia bacterium]|nr:aldehyde dehydrogenase family protein [Blastocatellia bacterium]